ncbi:ferrochelatase [Aquabacterium sp. A7-Y]|uniref:ferrochelatase n=1 Tax=Aquabacterium sp. A7-Y TaxID=1349605 RepID=UPI00223C9F14|nr:ferrochelatase [Aquabacterium sp. A7-Y]MCW7537752.1 ferrochelatase [Aquabacterium sp. A7-Y]
MRFRPEPPHAHGRADSTGLLLCNLGTPDAPTAPALRRYLAEFLSDPRVVEIPAALWKPILHGVVLRTRPAASAAKYASIWSPEGSPLRVWTDKQAKLLQGYLGERGVSVKLACAMRYGQPSIPAQLDALKAQGVTRVLVLPLYPQYSGTTTASVIDAVSAWAKQVRHVPELRFVNHYHDHPLYIEALARRIGAYWQAHGRPDRLVMSFHGVPRRTLALGDPYHCECQKTARLVAERLKLAAGQYTVTFQSRFGKAEWLQPYTEPSLRELGKAGVKRVDVACPGFVSDCIETLEEIAMEGRQAFLSAGGRDFHYIPCLNDQHEWIVALAAIAQQHLAGWPTSPPDAHALDQQRERARALGAAN